MNRQAYERMEEYMLVRMRDSAHDEMHVYRVLHTALTIAESHLVDFDVLIAACLLHDVGREAQFCDPTVDHAQAGAEMARDFLLSEGWAAEAAGHVADCVRTHRYRGNDAPVSIEAKILFDADKLDAAGALGVARTLLYSGAVGRPLCEPCDLMGEPGEGRHTNSFVAEYRYKLQNVYDRFFTREARKLAEDRRRTASDFFDRMMDELRDPTEHGAKILDQCVQSAR